jgi:hypothetical protein
MLSSLVLPILQKRAQSVYRADTHVISRSFGIPIVEHLMMMLIAPMHLDGRNDVISIYSKTITIVSTTVLQCKAAGDRPAILAARPGYVMRTLRVMLTEAECIEIILDMAAMPQSTEKPGPQLISSGAKFRKLC